MVSIESTSIPFYLTLLCALYTTHVVQGGGVVTDMDQLYDTIFTGYKSKVLPVLNHTDTVTVGITASAININEFDELSGELSLTMVFTFAWQDKRISWNLTENKFIKSVPVDPDDIWKPQVYLLQSSDVLDDVASSTVKPRLHHNGTVVWYTGKVIKVVCSMDVKYFPFDTQVCDILLLNWGFTKSELNLRPGKASIQKPHFSRNSRWELRPSTLSNCKKAEFQGIPCLSLKFVLKRRSHFYVVSIVVPLLLLGLTNNLVFVLPPSSGDRTSSSITIFLSFLIFMDIVNDMIPHSSKPMAYIYSYILYLLVYSCISVFLCVLSLRIYNKQTVVPRRVQTIVRYARFVRRRRSKRDGDTRLQDGGIDIPEEVDVQSSAGNVNVMSMGDLVNVVSSKVTSESACTETEREKQVKHRESGASDGVRVTWDVVGKTFDFYCCLLLSVVFIVFSLYTFVNLVENKGLHR